MLTFEISSRNRSRDYHKEGKLIIHMEGQLKISERQKMYAFFFGLSKMCINHSGKGMECHDFGYYENKP